MCKAYFGASAANISKEESLVFASFRRCETKACQAGLFVTRDDFYFKSAEMADDDKILKKITELEKDISVGAESTEAVPGTAILVNVTQNANGKTELSELARLADTAGLAVVAEVLQPKAS